LSMFFLLFSFMLRPPTTSTLFPYTSSSDLTGPRQRSLFLLYLQNSASHRPAFSSRPAGHRLEGEPGSGGAVYAPGDLTRRGAGVDRKSTRLNSSHVSISYAVFCLKKKNNNI